LRHTDDGPTVAKYNGARTGRALINRQYEIGHYFPSLWYGLG
jgi:hypothetical protein